MADNDDAVRELRVRQAVAVTRALYVAAEDLLGKAQRIAPLEEGTLSGSGTVTMIVDGRRYEGAGALAAALAAVTAEVRAGRTCSVDAEVSFNTVYAARQHEETAWQHAHGRRAKYLEQPFRESVGRYERLVAAAASRTM